MSCKSIMSYARLNRLHTDVFLAEIASEHRRKTGEEPVVVVHGVECAQHLYRNCDVYCGGQYKQFRKACRNFVQRISNCGVRLVFFFHGLVVKNETHMQASKDHLGKIDHMLETPHEGDASTEGPTPFPEGLISCARVIFAEEPSTVVRLSTGDVYQEAARFAANTENCLGVMSSNGSFLIYKGVPSLFTFDKHLKLDDELRMRRFRSSDIASHLHIQPQDLPAFATFMGDNTINLDELRHVHGRLGSLYGRREHLASVVAEVVKNNSVKKMCRIAFGHRWRAFLECVKASIDRYEYKNAVPEMTPEKTHWSEMLQYITAKHSSGQIPGVVLSVVKCRAIETGPALEDLSHVKYGGKATEEALRTIRRRMYTVLLWESGEGPFYVEEQVTRKSRTSVTQVEAHKELPPIVNHPGLLQLWTGNVETRWRLFSWIVGAPDSEGSALRSLEPQYMVVPAAALHYLRHEVRLLQHHEVEIFAVVAATVGRVSPQQLARKRFPKLDPRAVYLATLFVRTARHVLDAAAACGLSFPSEADCQLDAYFDEKFFHELYLKAKDQSFATIGTHSPWDPLYLAPIHQLLTVIGDSHTDTQ